MTNAEFASLCESIGLAPADISKHFAVLPRTAEYWFKGRPNNTVNVPIDVAIKVKKLESQADEMVRAAIAGVEKTINNLGDKPQEITLTRYRNDNELKKAHPTMICVKYHAIVLYRTKTALEALGHKCSIVYATENA